LDELSEDLLTNLNVGTNSKGALVVAVTPNSPAERAGLKTYDIIQEFNGQELFSYSQLRTRISLTKPGTEVNLGILRDGKKISIKVKVGDAAKIESQAAESNQKSQETDEDLGVQVSTLTKEMRKQLGIRSATGVIVTALDEEGYAAAAGIRRGDVIVEINRKSVKSPEDVKKSLSQAKSKSQNLLFLVERGGETQLIVLRVR
jgi:serine protease Do